MLLSDLGTDTHPVARSVRVAAGGYAVLGRSSDTAANGGVTVDYVFDGTRFQLGNNEDEVVLSLGGVELDRVVYDQKLFPDTKGRSMQLQVIDTTSNDTGTNWCEGTLTYGADGNIGTPGAVNDTCRPPDGDTTVSSG